MSVGATGAVAAVYAAYSGCFYVIDWLFAHGYPNLAVVAAFSALLVNWAAAAVATSGTASRLGNLLWLLFGAVIPFLGGAGLALFGGDDPHRSTGIALMTGTFLPVAMFVYVGAGHLGWRPFRGRSPSGR